MPTSLQHALLSSLPQPILAVDDSGHILELNEAAQRLLPAGTKKPIGKSLSSLLSEFSGIVETIHANQGGFKRMVELSNGQSAEATVSPLEGYGWAIVVTSRTTHKHSDANINVIGEVAHDLKQPLAAILSFSDVLTASGELNDKQVKFLGRIRSAATRMAEQVHQLLDMAWIESGMKLTFVEVDLVSLTKSMIEDVEARAATKNIVISLDAPASVPSVVADNTRLSQVIMNLLTNAIKYSPNDTNITVTIATEAGNVLLSFKDQGFGIAPEHIGQLFQRFQRIQDKQTKQIEGTGLGLYITRSVVEQHGGHITVESTPGEGSTFTVYLPIKVPTTSAPPR